jgi:hypothetical protein
MKLSTGDRLRIAFVPGYLAIGGLLIARWAGGERAAIVLGVGLAFVAFGLYRGALIVRALKGSR